MSACIACLGEGQDKMKPVRRIRSKKVRDRILWTCFGVGIVCSSSAISDTSEGVPFTELRNQVEMLQEQLESVARGADGACYDNSNRYVDCGNGTVTDTITGLIWLKDVNCFGLQDYATAQAMAASLKSGDCGLSDNSRPQDWRIPTADEWAATLFTARALDCDAPALTDTSGTACYSSIGSSPFINVDTLPELIDFWSANTIDQPFGARPTGAWVGFIGVRGLDLPFNAFVGVSTKTDLNPVWPVRGVGQRCVRRVGSFDPADCF